jgi:uncharacterized protein
VLTVTPAHARRFMLHALGLSSPFPDVMTALGHHGYVQLDPINVCGRMHDLILRHRVAGYREGDLLRCLHGNDPATPPRPDERRTFEHYFGVLAAMPVDAWPFLAEEIRTAANRPRTWWGRMSAKEERLAPHILTLIAERGPISSDDIEHDGRSVTAWNSNARLAKIVLEKLFVHGRVLIAARRAFRRVYDLPERVLPAAILARPAPGVDETRRWRVLMKLRQRRLARLNRQEVALVADRVQPVRVDDGGLVYCLREDVPRLDAAAVGPIGRDVPPRLLAPLDPLLYDRILTRRVWDFDYTWEVYTPPAKRVRGYYALPVLAGGALVGHVDPKADRERNRLRVMSRRVKRGVATATAVDDLARFLGLDGRRSTRPQARK